MTNQLGDILKEIRDPDLSPQRVEEIGRLMNEFDDRSRKVQSWLRFADSNPQFGTVYSRFGEFEVIPLKGKVLTLSSAQSIPNNTETTIVFTNASANTSAVVSLGNGIYQIAPGHLAYAVFGTCQWDTNGTGRRAVHMNAYDTNGASLFGLTYHSMLPTGLDIDTLPFAGVMYVGDLQNPLTVKLTVIQTSGGALDLQRVRAFLFPVI